MNFHEPVIDYAGISPIIALTVGLCVVLLSAVFKPLQRGGAGADPADPGQHRRAADLAVGRDARTWSPGRCGSTTWRSRSR